MMEPQKARLVMPGDLLGAEEEFLPSRSVYVEGGNVYSAMLGSVDVSEGKVSVNARGRETGKILIGMLVLGTVASEVGKVMFVRIDDIRAGNKFYAALGDGKIIGGSGRSFHERGMHSSGDAGKPCKEGDVILAKVVAAGDGAYTLDFYGPETGVVYSKCGNCGSEMRYEQGERVLVCDACKRREHSRVSSLYGKPNEIKVLLAKAVTAVQR